MSCTETLFYIPFSATHTNIVDVVVELASPYETSGLCKRSYFANSFRPQNFGAFSTWKYM